MSPTQIGGARMLVAWVTPTWQKRAASSAPPSIAPRATGYVVKTAREDLLAPPS